MVLVTLYLTILKESSLTFIIIGFFEITKFNSSPLWTHEAYFKVQTCVSKGYFVRSGMQIASCSVEGTQTILPVLKTLQSAELITLADAA